ncbi:hypothetical protein ACJX0J_006046, partial [Zea mays]
MAVAAHESEGKIQQSTRKSKDINLRSVALRQRIFLQTLLSQNHIFAPAVTGYSFKRKPTVLLSSNFKNDGHNLQGLTRKAT